MNDPLEAIRKKYRESLPDRIERLKNFRHRAESGEVSAYEALLYAVHALAGSGGLYGYWEITELAREAEHSWNQADFLPKVVRLEECLRVISSQPEMKDSQ